MEAHLLLQVSSVPASVGCHGASFRLAQLASLAPTAGLLDLVCLAWQPHLLRHFNPFMSAEACSQIQHRVQLWLQLCVLEDRLGRLEGLVGAGPDYMPMLIQVGGNGKQHMCSFFRHVS